jgi:hypothetical protein
VRDIILEGDFAIIMETLQAETKNVGDVSTLLQTAWELKMTYREKLAEIELLME